MDRDRIEIENEILEQLKGKIFLLQEDTAKREHMFQVFLEVYNSPMGKKFIRKEKGLDVEVFFNEFLSYGIIQEFLDDPEVEDIMVNYLSPIHIHKARVGLVRTSKRFESHEELELFIKKLIVFSGRKEPKKINDVELAEIKGRVNIIYSPFGPQITITRARENPLSVIELIHGGTLNPQLAAQFWMYVEGMGIKPANIIISGGPGAGKTTLLNALLSFVPAKDRIVVIEDTLELNTSLIDNCSRLDTDEDVTMADLVRNSLRMRPDRVIVGEVRGREAQDLMTCMNIGKYCMGTLHASTARETIMRLENEPMNAPGILVNLVDVFVIMRRYNVNNKVKRVVGEMVETGGMEKKMVLLSSLWEYDFSKGDYHESAISSIFRDRLAQMSGKPPRDIINEINLRAEVIRKMMEKNISSFSDVTNFCRKYSENPDAAIADLGCKKTDLIRF